MGLLIFNLIIIPIFFYIVYKAINTEIKLNKFKGSIFYSNKTNDYYWIDKNNKEDPNNIRFIYGSLKGKVEAFSTIAIILFLIITIVNGIHFN